MGARINWAAGPTPCVECGRLMRPSTRPPTGIWEGTIRHQSRGVCNTCIRRPPTPLTPVSVDAPPDWRLRASCAQADPELFFPSSRHSELLLRPLAVCEQCPVRDACLADAMLAEQDAAYGCRFGIWGGTTPSERAAMARSWQGAA